MKNLKVFLSVILIMSMLFSMVVITSASSVLAIDDVVFEQSEDDLDVVMDGPLHISVQGISLDRDVLHLTEGESRDITAVITPDDASNKEIVWISDDEGIATVEGNNERGIITGRGEGETVIKAITVDGEYEASCVVVVEERPSAVGGGGVVDADSENTLEFESDYYDDYYEYGEYKGFEYEIRSGAVTILWYSGNQKNVVIPETIKGYPVTEISEWAFNNSWTLESVVIPASVTEIGTESFAWCENLKKIEVAGGNENYITVDDVLYTSDMSVLVLYPPKKTTKNLIIPEGVKEIGTEAFSSNCDFIETVKLPASLISMDDSTFAWCHSLTKFEVAEGNTRFVAEEGILFNDKKTELIQYPSQKEGKSYNIPDGVRKIGRHAFIDTPLEEVTIPESVIVIRNESFAFCHSMNKIEVSKENENYTSVDGVLFDKEKTEIIKYPVAKKETRYTIPDSVEKIGGYAFYMAKKLDKITIPEGVEIIEQQAFSYCDALRSVVIPSTVAEIGSYAFSDCSNLKRVAIPKRITEIPYGMFCWCESLSDVYYEGTRSQWKRLEIGGDNAPLLEANINYEFVYDNSNGEDNEEEAVKEYNIAMNGSEAIAVGKTASFSAYIYYEENGKQIKTKEPIKWMSADEDVATVSNGNVKGIGIGTTTITAYNEELDLRAEIEISVVAPITTLKFALSSATIYVGNDFDLSEGMVVNPEEHTDVIVWESSDEDIATVDEYGVVTPIATGKVKISAKAVAGNKTATCTVTVSRMPEGIMFDGEEEIAVAQGKTATLKAYAYYEENGKIVKTKDVISWASDDEEIVTVSKGKLKGIGAGTTTITAYIEGTEIYETFEVSVVVPVKSLKFASTKATVYVGNDFDLSEGMVVNPEEHTDVIVWESSNEDIATVDEYGVVTSFATGKVKITAKAVAGKKSASVTITVK